MKTKTLGKTGLRVSEICLGTMTFGGQTNEEEARAIMDTAFEAGVYFIDTANNYPVPPWPAYDAVGRSEEFVGRWAKDRRDQLVLATKFRREMGPGPNDGGASRRHLMNAVEASLRRLQTDYIDLYQIHTFDLLTPIEETLRGLEDIVRTGKVRYIGCSNLPAWQVMKGLGISDRLGFTRFASVQPSYNLFNRAAEAELFPLCREEGLGVISYAPLSAGVLTGKYRRNVEAPAPDSRYVARNRLNTITESQQDASDAFAQLAHDKGVSMATLAVAWVKANPVVTAPIVGASRAEQLHETLAAADVTLSEEELKRCDEIAAMSTGAASSN